MVYPNLPFDIITNILSRLPPRPLLRFKCVSKPWRCLMEDPNFIKMHINRANNVNVMLRGGSLYALECYGSSLNKAVELDYPYKYTDDGVEIVGSCDGLVCVTDGDQLICLWNPSTQEFKKLPTTPIEFSGDAFCCRSVLYGVGFDSTIDDYKVVRVVNYYADGDDIDSEVKVYTLRKNTWKRVGDVPYHILYKRVPGVLVNGALHWAATRLPESDLSKVIASFDIVDEVFKEVPQPCYNDEDFHMNVGALGGCLCVLSNYNRCKFDLWVMKDYGEQGSWTTLFSFQQSVFGPFDFFKPLCYTKDAGILLERDGKDIVLYDPITEKLTTLEISGVPYWVESEAYVGSLVSLNSGTYVWQQPAKVSRKHNRKKGGKKRSLVSN